MDSFPIPTAGWATILLFSLFHLNNNSHKTLLVSSNHVLYNYVHLCLVADFKCICTYDILSL